MWTQWNDPVKPFFIALWGCWLCEHTGEEIMHHIPLRNAVSIHVNFIRYLSWMSCFSWDSPNLKYWWFFFSDGDNLAHGHVALHQVLDIPDIFFWNNLEFISPSVIAGPPGHVSANQTHIIILPSPCFCLLQTKNLYMHQKEVVV